MISRIYHHPAFPYCVPFITYMVILSLEPLAGENAALVYPLKALAVGAAILLVWRRFPPLNFNRPLATVGVGVIAFILWVALDPLMPEWRDEEKFFNPWVLPEAWAITWIIFRVIGASIMVPIMEEVFWRGFIQRWIDKEDFESVPIGIYTVPSFFGTIVLFALAHIEFGSAMLFAAICGWWFIKTRSIGNAILLHAVTNFLLAIYVLWTQTWYFW